MSQALFFACDSDIGFAFAKLCIIIAKNADLWYNARSDLLRKPLGRRRHRARNNYSEKGKLMHDIWNPWHGCVKISEGCEHCYMYYLDMLRGHDGSAIYKTKSGFDYPLQRDRHGRYKVKSGEMLRVCMNSDFFLPEADEWRDEAWAMIRRRSDVKFFILTKRPERALSHMPSDIGSGYENVIFNVTCENQRRADERIPILLELPFRHKGIMCAPFIGPVSIEKYLASEQIEQVICGGENYDGARPCNFDWVKGLRAECAAHNVTFCFIETGSVFIKNNKVYNIPSKRIQAEMAYKAEMYFSGKPIEWSLLDGFGLPLNPNELYSPVYGERCGKCGSRPICNGCTDCGKCGDVAEQ